MLLHADQAVCASSQSDQCLHYKIAELAISNISLLKLVSVAKKAGLGLTW